MAEYDSVWLCVRVCVSLQNQEVTLVQSQTCVQELTTELRNRCLELRDLREKDDELQQVTYDHNYLPLLI